MEGQVQRRFILGDEWLYLKIYSGPKTLESILVNELSEFVTTLFESQLIDKFFFVRFSDPDYHLRLRFHVPDNSNLYQVIYGFNRKIKPYIDNRLVWKVCSDTYNREFERYGKDTISFVETIFSYDSVAVLSFLKGITETGDEKIRWLWGAKCIDMLMSSFGLSLAEKSGYCNQTVEGFAEEVNMNKSLRIELDQKFRQESPGLRKVLDPDSYEIDLSGADFIRMYSDEAAKIIDGILFCFEEENRKLMKLGLLNSLIHMHFNRLFRTKQRLQEFVIYYLMGKYYESRIARFKYNNQAISG